MIERHFGCGVVRQVIFALSLLTLSRVANARVGDREKARNFFEEAAKRYNLGEYRSALGGFRGAYDEIPDPKLLFNIAQCYRQIGEHLKALTAYRSFLREVPDASNADDVRKIIATLGAELIREQEARRQQPQGVETPAVIAATPPPRPEPPRPWWRNTSAWAFAGVGVGLAATGAGLVGGSISIGAEARNAATLDQLHALQSRAQGMEIAGWAVLGVGAAGAIVGGVMLATHGSTTHRER